MLAEGGKDYDCDRTNGKASGVSGKVLYLELGDRYKGIHVMIII